MRSFRSIFGQYFASLLRRLRGGTLFDLFRDLCVTDLNFDPSDGVVGATRGRGSPTARSQGPERPGQSAAGDEQVSISAFFQDSKKRHIQRYFPLKAWNDPHFPQTVLTQNLRRETLSFSGSTRSARRSSTGSQTRPRPLYSVGSRRRGQRAQRSIASLPSSPRRTTTGDARTGTRSAPTATTTATTTLARDPSPRTLPRTRETPQRFQSTVF